MATSEKTMVASIVVPFGIEADHPRNCDLYVQSIPGCRLRSRMKPTTPTVDGIVRSHHVRGQPLPELPGMQLHVNPGNRTYVIVDPLNEDEEALGRLRRFLQAAYGIRNLGNIRGEQTRKGELDVHRMKTLCREMLNFLEFGEATLVKGPKPALEDIMDLPGKFLLNPGARTPLGMPQFEEDYDAWVDRLTRSGGG